MAVHLPARCCISGCECSAWHWFAAQELWGADYPLDTFYLCDDHASNMLAEDYLARWLDPQTQTFRATELAVYSCSDTCRECEA